MTLPNYRNAQSVVRLNNLPIKQIWSGVGSLESYIDSVEHATAVVVTSRSLHTSGKAAHTFAQLAQRFRGAQDVFYARAHVPRADVDALGERLSETHPDVVFGVGGSSVGDLIKAALGELIDNSQPKPFSVAVPTTLSGSEFAHFYGITETVGKNDTGDVTHKVSHAREDVVADVVVLDGKLAEGTPDQLWRSSGFKALDHAVEGLIWSTAPEPLAEILQCGIRAMTKILVSEITEPDAKRAIVRNRALLAGYRCYASPASMRLGLSHRIGHILGGRYGVPHGLTSPITMPVVAEAIHESGRFPLGVVERALDVSAAFDPTEYATQTGEHVGQLLRELAGTLQLPTRLGDVGITNADLPHIAREIAQDYPWAVDVVMPTTEGAATEQAQTTSAKETLLNTKQMQSRLEELLQRML